MRIALAFLIGLVLCAAPSPARADVGGTAGPYRVRLRTEPSVVPVGRAELLIRLSDLSGKPATGARVRALAKMPEMDMGEREAAAAPEPGSPGVYRAPASFAMEGGYDVRITVDGPAGAATGTLRLRTGQETAEPNGGGAGLLGYLPWVLGALLIVFVLFRMFRTGLRPNWRALFRPETIVGVGLIVVAIIGSSWAVRTFKRPNSMALVDALASDMSNMPAPLGRGPVELATVERGPVQATVRYTGSAVGYVEQDVYPRVTGWITWMPFYAGDRVRKGEVLARLDTREYQSRTEQRQADRSMAAQMEGIARLEYRQGLAAAAQARAEVGSKEGALEEVRRMHARAQAMLKESLAGVTEARSELRAMQSDLTAAREERAEAEAMQQSAQSMEPEAEAMLSAMRADQAYWTRQIVRMKVLLDNGAVSGEEFQRDEAMAKGADAKVRQAQAKLQGVRSDIRAAGAKVKRTEAMVESAGAKIAQSQSRIQGMEAKVEQSQAEVAGLVGRIRMAEGDLEAARANVRAMQAMAEAGAGRIRQAQAGIQSAQAALTTAKVVQGYTEIRSLVEGVVTQRLISPGVLVNPGQAILKVSQISPIRLQAYVAEADLERLRVGNLVTVRTQDGARSATARVASVAPEIDPVGRTGIVEALFPNTDRRFLPGQSLRIEISTGRAAAAGSLRVPATAVQWQSAPSSGILSTRRAAYVWLAEAAGEGTYTVRRVDVDTGAGDGRFIEVLSGLESGAKVVVRGQHGLREGDSVSGVTWGSEGPETLPAAAANGGDSPGSAKTGAPGHSGHGGH